MSAAHPYATAGLNLAGYMPLRFSQLEILAVYLGASLSVLLSVWLISGRCRRISRADRVLMCWWVFTGLTHILIEGPFVFTPDFFAKGSPNYFDEVWKEYSKGDSRYVARDTATDTVEGITAALEGPASLLAVYAIASRKSYSHILQFAVCLAQLALRMLGLLHYGLLGWLQLLGQSILLLGIFHRCKQFMGCDTNADRHKKLEEDLRSDSSKRKANRTLKPILVW